MKIIARCTNCGRDVQGGANWAGREGKCPGCGQPVRFSAAPAIEPSPFLPAKPPRQDPPAFSTSLQKRTRLVVAFLCGCATVAVPMRIWQVNQRDQLYGVIAGDFSMIASMAKEKKAYVTDKLEREDVDRSKGRGFHCSPEALREGIASAYAAHVGAAGTSTARLNLIVAEDVEVRIFGGDQMISRVEVEYPGSARVDAERIIQKIADRLDLAESVSGVVNAQPFTDDPYRVIEQFGNAEASVETVSSDARSRDAKVVITPMLIHAID